MHGEQNFMNKTIKIVCTLEVAHSCIKCCISVVVNAVTVAELSAIHPAFEQCSVSARIQFLDS